MPDAAQPDLNVEETRMFATETVLNQFLLEALQQIMSDIPADAAHSPAPGNGHPPLWVLGHLAICGQLGLKMVGQSLDRPEWLPLFGPGSSDKLEHPEQFSSQEFLDNILSVYPQLCQAVSEFATVNPAALQQPHGVELLKNTPIQTLQQLLIHLLTSHFSFHLAQLSGWRRAAGYGPLF